MTDERWHPTGKGPRPSMGSVGRNVLERLDLWDEESTCRPFVSGRSGAGRRRGPLTSPFLKSHRHNDQRSDNRYPGHRNHYL